MKKLILLSVFLLSICFASKGQISFDTNYHENLNVDFTEFDYQYTYYLTNNAVDLADTLFEWEITNIEKEDEWDYTVIAGFNGIADPEPKDTFNFELTQNSDEYFKLAFNLYGNAGQGTITLTVWSKLHPEIRDSITLTINARDLVSIDNFEVLEANIYPNPTSNIITIQTKPGASYTLTNLQGQVIKEGKLSDATSYVDISDIQSGTYFIRVMNDGKVRTEKVMVK